MERLLTEEQAWPRRHIAALSGRDRVMAETYGEGGGPKLGCGVWCLGPGRMRPVEMGRDFMLGGGVCYYGVVLVDAGRGLVGLMLNLIDFGGDRGSGCGFNSLGRDLKESVMMDQGRH